MWYTVFSGCFLAGFFTMVTQKLGIPIVTPTEGEGLLNFKPGLTHLSLSGPKLLTLWMLNEQVTIIANLIQQLYSVTQQTSCNSYTQSYSKPHTTAILSHTANRIQQLYLVTQQTAYNSYTQSHSKPHTTAILSHTANLIQQLYSVTLQTSYNSYTQSHSKPHTTATLSHTLACLQPF